jgi:predicted Ser/Thr protein kinase
MSVRAAPPDDDSVHDADTIAPPQSAAKLKRGAIVGRYLILDELGAGGMSVVYKAHDPDLDRTVALKLVLPFLGERAVQFRDFLLREAQALARLSHPNVVAVHDVGTFESQVFLAMEYVDGQTLRQWLKQEPRGHREVLQQFLAAGQGLAAAHRAELVHRDFKPDNVIIGKDGRVRVLDFGLVRATNDLRSEPMLPIVAPSSPPAALQNLGDDTATPVLQQQPPPISSLGSLTPITPRMLASSLSQAGYLLGTPRYMAPEQHLRQRVDGRTDQFGFCAALYEALYGRPPFNYNTMSELREEVLAGRFAPAPKDAKVPSRLRAILLRGLSPEPDARWPDMASLLAELGKDRAAAWRRAGLIAGGVTALAAVVGGGVVAVHVKRTAARQAQLANEFGQEVAEISMMARYAALLPLHDLRREMREIEERMAAIEAQMRSLGDVATGPGHYALGRGYVALERWDQALAHLDAAYKSGYRSPELAFALGLVHANLYQKGLAEISKIDDPKSAAAKREAIARTHRDPALRDLGEVRGSGRASKGMATPEYAEGLIALIEARYDEALALAHKAAAQSASLYEAHTLEGDIYYAIAQQQSWKRDGAAELKALEQAGQAYRAATDIARSSVAALTGDCRRLISEAICQQGDQTSANPEAMANAALVACGLAEKARPDDASLLAEQARAWSVLCRYQTEHGQDARRAYEEASKLAATAFKINPKEVASYRMLVGKDPDARLSDALAVCSKDLESQTNDWTAYIDLAGSYSANALELLAQGGDPVELVEQARATIKQAFDKDPNLIVYRYMSTVELVAARVALAHKRDPLPAFAAAEAAARRAMLRDDKEPEVVRLVIEILRRRADWAVRNQRPLGSDLQDGLALVARLEALTPDEAAPFAEEGALHLLAALAATEPSVKQAEAGKARAAFDKAFNELGPVSNGEYRALRDEAAKL